MGNCTKGLFCALCLVALLAIHCDELDPPEGQLECTSDEDCPPDWYCNVTGDGLCYSDTTGFPEEDEGL